MIEEGALTSGHARALLALATHREQLALARRIVERNMSVRQVEAEVGLVRTRKPVVGRRPKEKPAHLVDLEKAFASYLGTRVAIEERRGGKGRITIEFYSYDDFERLASLMGVPLPR
jgi:ParB family chromosome partitioning protein